MTVCSFFLQGRCRYGDKCWNEHPRGGNRGGGGGGGGGGYNENNYSRSSGQQQPRGGGGGGGGFGNRVWVNPSQQKGGYIQPSSFSSHGSNDWGRSGGGGGGGRRDNVKSSEFSFSNQNRFSSFNSPSTFDRRGGGGSSAAGDDDDDKKLEVIQMDMDIWESSGQWAFSCYSNSKASLSGFADLSPEELRVEYYNTRASGDVQTYVNGVNQLHNQWKSRIQDLKIMNPITRTALLAELNGEAPLAPPSGFGSTTATGFGSSTSGFGSSGFGAPAAATVQASSFSFSGGGFGATAAQPPSSGFGSILGPPPQPPSGFGGSSAPSATPSASAFSFAAPTPDKPAAPSGFGSAAGFSFSSAASSGGGFGGSLGAPASSSSIFGQPSGGFGAASAPPSQAAGSAAGASDSLLSQGDQLTEDELNQFKAKRFTLGQIPLKPPPANLLML